LLELEEEAGKVSWREYALLRSAPFNRDSMSVLGNGWCVIANVVGEAEGDVLGRYGICALTISVPASYLVLAPAPELAPELPPPITPPKTTSLALDSI